MELRRLHYFVAEELSFNRAARRLHMAQPPLSVQIKNLEEELGVLLLERTSRGVVMTEAGEFLHGEAPRLLVQVDQTVSQVRRVGQGEVVGRPSLGFVPSASNEALPPILGVFGERYPGVELFLREMRPDLIVSRLHERQIDAGLLYLPLEDPSLDVVCVSREPLVLALSERHPLVAEERMDLASVAEEPFVRPAKYGRMPGLYGQVTATCRQAGFVPKAVWLMQTIVGLVAGGTGVALVPASLRNLHRKGVVYRPVRGLTPTVELGIIRRRDDQSKGDEHARTPRPGAGSGRGEHRGLRLAQLSVTTTRAE